LVRVGYRWRVDSAMNGIFGEYVTAGKFANMVKGMIMKAFIYIYNISRRSEASRGRPAGGGTAGPLAGGRATQQGNEQTDKAQQEIGKEII